MADFTLHVRGVTVGVWTDPAFDPEGSEGVRPSRVNPRAQNQHPRYLGQVGRAITVVAEVAGIQGPADTALGGRLFSAWFVEGAVLPLALNAAPARTSVQQFTALSPGHYTVGMSRPDGGLEHVHVDVQ